MKQELLSIKQKIEFDLENAKNTRELYQLLSSYNAYSILLLKAKIEYERKQEKLKNYRMDCNCYENKIEELFSSFNSDECLKVEQLSGVGHKDMLFLINHDTLLRLESFPMMNKNTGGLAYIDYKLIRISNCIGKVYDQNTYCGDPYYCDYHWEDKKAFGLFYNRKLVAPSYILDNQLKTYHNMDIREILKPQSLDEIYEKITDVKDEKAKQLVLAKYNI